MLATNIISPVGRNNKKLDLMTSGSNPEFGIEAGSLMVISGLQSKMWVFQEGIWLLRFKKNRFSMGLQIQFLRDFEYVIFIFP